MIEAFSANFLRQLQQLKIHSRRAFLGSRQGSHRSLRRGHGLEFADYRVYTPGDDFRHIDWGVLARSDRLYVRQFREEQDLNLLFLLDASASMGFPESRSKFDLAAEVALALSYVALTDGDAVVLSALGHVTTPRYVGVRSIHRASKELRDVRPGGHPQFTESVRAALARVRTPGKCFVFSDFLFPLDAIETGLDRIRARNFDLTVIQILAPEEQQLPGDVCSGVLVDSETGQELELSATPGDYEKLLRRHVGQLEQYCRDAAIPFVQLSSTDDITEVVLGRLPEFGILK